MFIIRPAMYDIIDIIIIFAFAYYGIIVRSRSGEASGRYGYLLSNAAILSISGVKLSNWPYLVADEVSDHSDDVEGPGREKDPEVFWK
jgi:hypothetical protein